MTFPFITSLICCGHCKCILIDIALFSFYIKKKKKKELHKITNRVRSLPQTTGYFWINDWRPSIPGSLAHQSGPPTCTGFSLNSLFQASSKQRFGRPGGSWWQTGHKEHAVDPLRTAPGGEHFGIRRSPGLGALPWERTACSSEFQHSAQVWGLGWAFKHPESQLVPLYSKHWGSFLPENPTASTGRQWESYNVLLLRAAEKAGFRWGSVYRKELTAPVFTPGLSSSGCLPPEVIHLKSCKQGEDRTKDRQGEAMRSPWGFQYLLIWLRKQSCQPATEELTDQVNGIPNLKTPT